MKYKLKLGISQRFEDDIPTIYGLENRFRHSYIIGKTGMGKSSLLERMALYDIEKGIATIFIDPKGDSVNRLYALSNDKSKIQLISIENPIVINPLNKPGYKLDNLIQEFIQILDVLVTLTASNPESTVLMREIIVMAVKSILKEENKNLDYLTKLLMYQDKRKELLLGLKPMSPEWIYWKEFDEKDGRTYRNKFKIESAQRVASRLVEISTGEMRNFVVGKNELDISDIVKNGKVILVDTSRMNRNSRIYLSNLIVYSVLSYCEFSKNIGKPLMVYVDEFQIVVSSLFSELLARSRSSGIGFTLAHQTFHQIPTDILSDIFGTVDTKICFRTGDEEARRFAPLFGIKPSEIFNLPIYNAWVRIGTENMLIETYPPQLSIVPDIEIPKLRSEQLEIPALREEFNFLGDEWVYF